MSFINVTIEWSLGLYHTHTPTVILFGYMLPFVINAFEFTLRTIKEYREDLSTRAKAANTKRAYDDWCLANPISSRNAPIVTGYTPTLTIGHIFARLLGIFTPFINFIVMICNMDRVFDWIGEVFSWMGRVFSIPLVPKR